MPSSAVPWEKAVAFLLAVSMASLLACGDPSPNTPSGPGTDQPGDGQTVAAAFADTSLEQAVRQALAQPTGDLSPVDLHSLTSLSAASRGIVDLHGIEQLDSLIALDLSNNRIVDLTPLDSLTHLQMLDLSWNQVSDLRPLDGLQTLQFLGLNGNPVRDLTPLLGLGALSSLEAVGNPLDESSLTSSVPILQARGVKVWLGTTEEPAVVDDAPVGLGLPGRIAFRAKPDYEQGNYDLYVLSLDPFELAQITATAEDDYEPAWSPDGRRLAFARRNGSRRDICVVEVDYEGGHHLTNLTQGEGDNRTPCWSPDGRTIAFCRSTPTALPSIYTVSVDGGDLVQLLEIRWGAQYPSWSPDGAQMVFTSPKEDGLGPPQLWVMDADGGNLRRLTDDRGFNYKIAPRWSAGGTRIIFGAVTSYMPDIHGLDAEGGNPVNYGQGTYPSWVMGDSRLLYMAEYACLKCGYEWYSDLYLKDPAGGAVVNLSRLLRDYRMLNTLYNAEPSWTPTSW